MTKTGTLTISGGISRVDETRLMKGAKNNGGFGRATDFLQLDRQLKNNDQILVDGSDDLFGAMPIILITNASKVGVEHLAAENLKALRKSPRKASARKGARSTSRKRTGSKKTAKRRRSK